MVVGVGCRTYLAGYTVTFYGSSPRRPASYERSPSRHPQLISAVCICTTHGKSKRRLRIFELCGYLRRWPDRVREGVVSSDTMRRLCYRASVFFAVEPIATIFTCGDGSARQEARLSIKLCYDRICKGLSEALHKPDVHTGDRIVCPISY